MGRETKRPYIHRAHGVTVGRGRNMGKSGPKATTLTSRRRKAAALTAKLEESLESLGDPRDSMSLEEKKRLALFYFFSQVPLS